MKHHFTDRHKILSALFTFKWQPLGESNSSCLDENQMS